MHVENFSETGYGRTTKNEETEGGTGRLVILKTTRLFLITVPKPYD